MGADWRAELGKIMDGRTKATRAEVENARFAEFLATVVTPVLKELADELGRHDRKVAVRETTISSAMTVSNGDTEEISFRVLARSLPSGIVPYAEIRLRKGQRLVKAESYFKGAGQANTIELVKGPDIIACFLSYYRTAIDVGQG